MSDDNDGLKRAADQALTAVGMVAAWVAFAMHPVRVIIIFVAILILHKCEETNTYQDRHGIPACKTLIDQGIKDTDRLRNCYW